MNSLKLPLLVAVATIWATLAACTGPISAEQSPISIYPQVRTTSYWLSTWTKVQPPVVHRVGAGQLEVAVPIDNLTDEELIIDFQYRFLRDGAECEERSGWHNLRIPRKGSAEVKFTSMTALPTDFDVMLRYRQ